MQRYGLRMGAICAMAIFGASVFGASVVEAQTPAQAPRRAGACGQIITACQQAGFERGAAKAGNGIAADCIRPIMQNRPQPRRAAKPLPQVAPELVAACAAANPSFGQRTRAVAQPLAPGQAPAPGEAPPPAAALPPAAPPAPN
jgi:hypothetical protein